MEKFNVLQILPELNYGGVEIETLIIAKYLSNKKYGSFIASSGGKLISELKKFHVTHIKLNLSSKNPVVILLNAFRLIKLIRKNNINIIHARSRAPAWSAYFACLITKCKFITTFHGIYGSSTPIKRWYNSVMLRGDYVIAISDFVKKHIETRYHLISDKLKVIYRGVDLEQFNPEVIDQESINIVKKQLDCFLDGKVILLPARFTKLKGHIYLLNALKYLKESNYVCLMVGACHDRHARYVQELKQLIEEYGLSENVNICQGISNMQALYSICDVVVSTSIMPEAFGRTIIEAQAMKKPVIATKIGASVEIIEDKETGFLVSPTDSHELSMTLDKVFSMPKKEINKITNNAFIKVQRLFSLDKMCNETLKLYQELIEDSLNGTL